MPDLVKNEARRAFFSLRSIGLVPGTKSKNGGPESSAYQPPSWWHAALEGKVGKRKRGRKLEAGALSLEQIAEATGLSIYQVGRCLRGASVTMETVVTLSRVYGLQSPVYMVATQEEAEAVQAALFRVQHSARLQDLRTDGKPKK